MRQKKPMGMESKKWKGYTLKELEYQKAIALVRMEMQKERIRATKDLVVSSYASKNAMFGILGKFASDESLLNKAIIGYSIFKTARRIFRKFKKKSP